MQKVRSFVLCAALFALVGCTETPFEAHEAQRDVPQSVSKAPEEYAHSLARAFARAASEAERGRALAAAFRASPYPEGKLHLRTYLASPEGAPFGDALSAELGSSWVSVLGALPDLELYLPLPNQRESWTGEGQFVVVGSSRTDSEVRRAGVLHLSGYNQSGSEVAVPLREQPAFYLLSLVPTEIGFPIDPVSGIVPREIDEALRKPADQTYQASMGYGTGLYIDHMWIRWSEGWAFDQVPYGNPEIELYFARRRPGTTNKFDVPQDIHGVPCASDNRPNSSNRYYDYNTTQNQFGNDALVASGTLAQLGAIYGDSTSLERGYLFIIDNDDTACSQAGTPSLSQFSTDHWYSNDDDLILGIVVNWNEAYPFVWYNPVSGYMPYMFELNYGVNVYFPR